MMQYIAMIDTVVLMVMVLIHTVKVSLKLALKSPSVVSSHTQEGATHEINMLNPVEVTLCFGI